MKYAKSTIQKHRRQWLAALESGELQQCRGALVKTKQSTGEPVSFCCLGVASILSGTSYVNVKGDINNNYRGGRLYFEDPDGDFDSELGQSQLLPEQAMDWLGLTVSDPCVAIPVGHKRNKYGYGAGGSVSLASLNDSGVSFAEIAALIREFGFVAAHDAFNRDKVSA